MWDDLRNGEAKAPRQRKSAGRPRQKRKRGRQASSEDSSQQEQSALVEAAEGGDEAGSAGECMCHPCKQLSASTKGPHILLGTHSLLGLGMLVLREDATSRPCHLTCPVLLSTLYADNKVLCPKMFVNKNDHSQLVRGIQSGGEPPHQPMQQLVPQL